MQFICGKLLVFNILSNIIFHVDESISMDGTIRVTCLLSCIILDRVTKPTISCEINNASTSESAGKATLLCSLPSHSDQSLLKFQWSTNAKIQPGHMLKIPLRGEFDDHQYNCTVNNPLTQESAVFFAKDCYHGNVFVSHF